MSLVDALARPEFDVVWIQGTNPVDPPKVIIDRDVVLCGPSGRAPVPDLEIRADVQLERLYLQPAGQAAVHVTTGRATLVDCELAQGSGSSYGLWIDPEGRAEAWDVVATGWVGLFAAPIVSHGRLELHGGWFEGNLSGVVRAISLDGYDPAQTSVDGGAYQWNGSLFRRGGAIAQFGGTLDVSQATFAQEHVGFHGGALYARFATVTITDTHVEAGWAASKGGALYALGSEVELRGGSFRGDAVEGGAIYVGDRALSVFGAPGGGRAADRGGGVASRSSVVDVDGLIAKDNSALEGATWWSDGDRSWRVREAEVCRPLDGPSLELVDPQGASLASSALVGGDQTHLRVAGGLLSVQNVTVSSGAVGLANEGAEVEVRNTLFADLPGGAVVGSSVDGGYNLVHLATIEALGPVSEHLVQGDPEFVSGAGACDRDLLPGPDSPALDAGDPSLPDPEDGRPLDIGWFQGGDRGEDPIETEPPEGCEPSAEVPDDGIDQDCDGFDASSWLRGGACDTGGGGGSWLAALWAAVARRRARWRSASRMFAGIG